MTTIDRIMIERIDISAFGGVKNLTLIPSGGINVITAPNESGKSTVAAFIKFIFYGFGGQRRQALAENERSLYMPWDGSRAGGGITLSTPEGRFRIERYQSAAKETLDIYDAYTRKSVFTGLIPGEVFFGVGEETFSKVLFFRQLYQSKNGDDALAEQVQNIIFSADEKTNTERAVKRLKELRASLKNNQKRGMIPTLENELASYDEKLASSVSIKNELDSVLVSLGEKKQKIAFNRTKLDALEKEKENLRKYEAKQKLASLLSLARADKDAQARYEECVKQFSGDNIPDTELVRSLINDNSELALAEKRVSELSDAASAEKSRLDSIEGSDPFGGADTAKIKSSLKRRTALGYLFLALCVACIGGAAALYFTSGAGIPVFACAGGAALFAALFAIFVLGKPRDVKKYGFTAKAELEKALEEQPLIKVRAEEQRKKLKSTEQECESARTRSAELKRSIGERIESYMSDSQGEYDELLRRMLDNSIEAGKLKAEKISLGKQLEEQLANVDLEELKSLAADAYEPKRDASAVTREYEFYTSASAGLRTQELELEKQRASLEARSPSPSVLYGKREAVKNRLDVLERKYASLGVALEVLDESREYMRSTVSPKLAQIASGYFAPATGGKYGELTITNDLSMAVSVSGGEKEADYLSAGARDTAYMCLRLALVDLLYSRAKPFLVLDDVFSRLDDVRLAYMLREIAKCADNSQIFIMTCHERESIALSALSQNVKKLELK